MEKIKFKKPLKSGSVILFRKKGFMPFLIRKIARTEYNHAGVILHFRGKNYVAEALAEGTRVIPLDHRLNDPDYSRKVRIYEPVYPGFDENVFWDELFSIVGKNYDFFNLLFVQFWYYTANIWLGPKTEKAALRTLNCYEVVYYLHRRAKTFRQYQDKWWLAKVNDIIENKFGEFKLVFEMENYQPTPEFKSLA